MAPAPRPEPGSSQACDPQRRGCELRGETGKLLPGLAIAASMRGIAMGAVKLSTAVVESRRNRVPRPGRVGTDARASQAFVPWAVGRSGNGAFRTPRGL